MFSVQRLQNGKNSLHSRVNRVSAAGAVHSGSIPIRVKPMTIKKVFTAFLLNAQNQLSAENKPASLLVVSLGKALSGIPTSKRVCYIALSAYP